MAIRSPVGVLVVEDSRLFAAWMREAIAAHPRLRLVGVASDGERALELVRKSQPDVVTVDVGLPGMDGITLIQYIMMERPTPCVVVSATTGRDALETYEAYEVGAVDVVAKPRAGDSRSMDRFRRVLTAKILQASFADVSGVTRFSGVAGGRPVSRAAGSRPRPHALPGGPAAIVVIGASTGGPRTLLDVVSALPADLPAPVLVVQHMPEGFTASLAHRLDEVSAVRVRHGDTRETLEAGTAYVAPGGCHTEVVRGAGGRLRLVQRPARPEDLVAPSVDRAVHSAVQAVGGERVVAALLTGLGDDGAAGLGAVRAAGGWTLAESAESAVVWGMPRAAAEAGAACEVLPASEMAAAIAAAVDPEAEA